MFGQAGSDAAAQRRGSGLCLNAAGAHEHPTALKRGAGAGAGGVHACAKAGARERTRARRWHAPPVTRAQSRSHPVVRLGAQRARDGTVALEAIS